MLPPEERAIAWDITLNMDMITAEISKLTADGVLDETEAGCFCLPIPRWEIHPARLREWVENRDPAEWQGLTLEAARFERLARETRPQC